MTRNLGREGSDFIYDPGDSGVNPQKYDWWIDPPRATGSADISRDSPVNRGQEPAIDADFELADPEAPATDAAETDSRPLRRARPEDRQPPQVLKISGLLPPRWAEAKRGEREKTLAQLEHQRQQVLDLLPETDAHPEESRVDDFYARQGLQTHPVRVLTQAEITDYRTRLAKAGITNPTLDKMAALSDKGATNSAYFHHLGVGVIRDDTPHDKSFRKHVRLSGTMAHEKAHSTAEDAKLYRHGGSVGAKVFTLKGPWEEAFAEYKRAEYIRTVLGLPCGLWRDPSPVDYSDESVGLDVSGIPPAYLEFGEPRANGQPNDSSSTVDPRTPLGYGLELLIANRPVLYEQLNRARHSEDGRRAVEYLIDSVQPDMYVVIGSMEESYRDMSYALLCIQTFLTRSRPWAAGDFGELV